MKKRPIVVDKMSGTLNSWQFSELSACGINQKKTLAPNNSLSVVL